MPAPHFTRKVIGTLVNDQSNFNTFSAVGDINGNGKPDIVLCGRMGKMVWFENPGGGDAWKQHVVDEPGMMECGGKIYDITGNGLGDIVNGGDWRVNKVFWWENPGAGGGPWKKRVVLTTGNGQFHDTAIGDITGDGVVSLVVTNQQNGTDIFRVPVPRDPSQEPWPGLERIAGRMRVPNERFPLREDQDFQPEEGLAIGDVDGDGKNELVCGTHWYKYAGGAWQCHAFAPETYLSTKVQIGDIDGDGKNEIVLSEGDPCIYGKTEGGTVAWFKPGNDITAPWAEHILESGLLDAHSLGIGDICGNGRADIFVGEIGIGDGSGGYKSRAPRLLLFENDGRGSFLRHVIDEGTGTHDAVLADMRGTGALDIVGKPLHGNERWNVHVWYNGGV
ncbi:MAG: hypothetical protein GF418_14080 [Chitinivibrionales bacterium]|nr:hypothetical protein [Chitinivibrionales bacterium]MBD3396747.1 hypothetical protein [Chitinivibrionales bacterium]